MTSSPPLPQHFRAPWGRPLIWISIIATILCAALAIFRFQILPSSISSLRWAGMLGLLPMLILLLSAPFTIRGYVIAGNELLIQRLFWFTRVPLHDLLSAEFIPKIMNRSLRTFGNGGLYSITGFYWNKTLGSFRAYVTDLNQTVVLKFPKRTLVVSPEKPEEFVAQIDSARFGNSLPRTAN